MLAANLRNEIQGSLKAYESLWQARADMLRSVSRALSNMSDVRRAFCRPTTAPPIQDTAAEFWTRVAQNGDSRSGSHRRLPRHRSSGRGDRIALAAAATFRRRASSLSSVMPRLGSPSSPTASLWRAAASTSSSSLRSTCKCRAAPACLSVLVAGFPVDQLVARDLKDRTGGSDFVFLAGGLYPLLPPSATPKPGPSANEYRRGSGVQDLELPGREFAVLGNNPARSGRGAPRGAISSSPSQFRFHRPRSKCAPKPASFSSGSSPYSPASLSASCWPAASCSPSGNWTRPPRSIAGENYGVSRFLFTVTTNSAASRARSTRCPVPFKARGKSSSGVNEFPPSASFRVPSCMICAIRWHPSTAARR